MCLRAGFGESAGAVFNYGFKCHAVTCRAYHGAERHLVSLPDVKCARGVAST